MPQFAPACPRSADNTEDGAHRSEPEARCETNRRRSARCSYRATSRQNLEVPVRSRRRERCHRHRESSEDVHRLRLQPPCSSKEPPARVMPWRIGLGAPSETSPPPGAPVRETPGRPVTPSRNPGKREATGSQQTNAGWTSWCHSPIGCSPICEICSVRSSDKVDPYPGLRAVRNDHTGPSPWP